MDSNNQFKCNNYKILNSIINREDIRTNELVPHPMGYISAEDRTAYVLSASYAALLAACALGAHALGALAESAPGEDENESPSKRARTMIEHFSQFSAHHVREESRRFVDSPPRSAPRSAPQLAQSHAETRGHVGYHL